jgi:hypothetical protein
MTSKVLIIALSLFLCHGAVFAVAQDTKPLAIPEKTMAARLQTYETPALSKPI